MPAMDLSRPNFAKNAAWNIMAAQKNYICVKEEEVAELLGQDGIRMRNGHKHFYEMVDTKNTIDVEPVEVDPTKVAPV